MVVKGAKHRVPAWKALIEEEFGDGIMSAIDFDMTIDRQADPKGDRVKIAMTGKFLPTQAPAATELTAHELRYSFIIS